MTDHEFITAEELARLIGRARCAVALTGAGLSTSAGIPDFRGPKGLYVTRRYDPERVFEIGWFRREPRYFFDFAWDFATMAGEIRPTFGHRFLSSLARKGVLSGVVTQNIDLLHQEAGSGKVIELHGSFGSGTCLECGEHFCELSYPWWLEVMEKSSEKPVARCACGGLLKPDIVFFGEPVHRYEEAEVMIADCDLLLVLGSSLNVMPASLLPYATSAPTVVINRGEIGLGAARHRFVVNEDLDRCLKDVARLMGMSEE